MSKSKADVTPDSTPAPEESTPAVAEKTSMDIIRRNVMFSIAAGLVPLPFVDIAAVTATQLKMIGELADYYETPFDAERGKSVIGALFASLGAFGISRGILGSAIKAIPVIGTIGGLAVVPAMSGAATYALGKVFAAHFASGGTLLNFEAGSMKAEFASQLKVGEQFASELKEKVTAKVKG